MTPWMRRVLAPALLIRALVGMFLILSIQKRSARRDARAMPA